MNRKMLTGAPWLSLLPIVAVLALDDPTSAQVRRRRPQWPPVSSQEPAVPVRLDTRGKYLGRIRTVAESGGRLDWCHDGNHVIFDRLGPDGYYDVYATNPEGRDQECLTCGKSNVPDGHKGNPACHPSGRTIVFQAAERQPRGGRAAFLDAWLTNPGAGFRNDLWLTGIEGDHYVQLTDVGSKGAVLHAHFSDDGSKLLWAQRVASGGGPSGVWAIMIGDFRMEGKRPRLSNIRKYQPGSKPRFYETHGFFKDGSVLISSNSDGQEERGYDIYRFDYRTGKSTRLTDTPSVWDEHAQLSPDGTRIVWMSGQDLKTGRSMRDLQTEFWIMDSDGSDKRRLTYFTDPSAPEHISSGWVIAADSAWSADSRRLIAYVKTDQRTNSGPLLSLELP